MSSRSRLPFDMFAMRVDVPVSTAVRDGSVGPASTGLPVAGLGNEERRIAIDVVTFSI